jgi:hypothetical protein
MTSKITVAAAAAALALGMSAMFGGVAFAGGEHGTSQGGAGGAGGSNSVRCAIPFGLTGALLIAQSNDIYQCNINGGNGGNGGSAS